MDDASRVFEGLRPRLLGVAYRMLQSAAEAESIVQQAWLHFNKTGQAKPGETEARLFAITTRLCLERLREKEGARYVGPQLPKPLEPESPATPEQMLERADDISVVFLASLERLPPEACSAFLLRQVFGVDYAELAHMLGKSEAECRLLVRQAKAQLREALRDFDA